MTAGDSSDGSGCIRQLAHNLETDREPETCTSSRAGLESSRHVTIGALLSPARSHLLMVPQLSKAVP